MTVPVPPPIPPVEFGAANIIKVIFIYLVLFAQLFLFLGRTALELIRSWILLHLSTRISISLISDFFIKLMNLPISFFDVRMTGDIIKAQVSNASSSASLDDWSMVI